METAALVFDMYGTLADPAGWADALEGHVREPQQVATAWRRHQLEISWLLSLMERYEDWRIVTGYALDAALAEADVQLSEAKQRELLERTRIPRLFDDVPQALDALAAAGFTMAVFSNGTFEQLKAIVRETGLDDYFTDVISVDEVGVFKPAPTVYRYAANKLGREIGRVWLVSANPFDAAGAKLAGMRAAKLKRGPSLSYGFAPPPDLVVASLAELAGALACVLKD